MNPDNDPKQGQGGRPATKFKERPTPKPHPENRPDVDEQPVDSKYEQANFEIPPGKGVPKQPDPNWKKGKFTKGYEQDKDKERS
jgi:hypothetical protein